MNNLRPESHVAQQIRRDKLRIQNSSQHFQEFPNNLEQLSLHPEFNMNLVQVRSVRNANILDEHAAVYSSEMPHYNSTSNPLDQELGAAEPSRLIMNHQQYGSFPHSLAPPDDIHSPQKEQCDLGNWRNSIPQSHQVSDWIVNYAANCNTNSSLFATELNNEQFGVMHHTTSSSPLYQNALQDIVKLTSISAQGSDMASLMQQTGQGFVWRNQSDSNPQSLSLSLSSNAQSKAHVVSQFQEGDLQSGCGTSKEDPQCVKYVKPSIISRDNGKSLQEVVGLGMPSSKTTSCSYRNVGPLGPFTGYATILKSSRFLKIAQQLLDEFCCVSVPKLTRTCGVSSSTSAADTVNDNETGAACKGSYSGYSSSMFHGLNENSADWGAGSSFGVSSRPDYYQQKKAKLLYMQEEVSRRCKQYHQQMQMVFSSFESVSGLSSATPYISLVLKSVSKHFRCLNNAISDQLKLISEVFGEDLSIPTTNNTSSKLVDTNMASLRCMDQSLQKNKPGTKGFLEQQQHVWRPQRGFPERAVAILKAWLFEHFLHPYPTDTDKHMLATQTGLSRNQVSNWFINARVRVWKPMVEEVHMLEKKPTGANESYSKNEGTSNTEGGSSQPRVNKALSKFGMHSIPENQFRGMELGEKSKLNAEEWSQEKRSKLECQMTSSMDGNGTPMGFLPYRGGGPEVGGLGSVSLTLGLRHGVEGVQHQQQLREEQLRHHYLGDQMIHHFVG